MRAISLACLLVLAGCYRPDPQDGSFRCSPDLGSLCPDGLICSSAGLCVRSLGQDLSGSALDLAADQGGPVGPRSCEERVRSGAFANLVPLMPANTAADEEHLALDPTGTAPRLLFQRGSSLFSAAIMTTDPKTIATPQAVTLLMAPTTMPPPPVIHGGSFTIDGKLWFAGTVAGTTSLYAGTPSGATGFTVAAPRAPTATTCAFSDPVFLQGDATFQLYAAYALAGCGGASYVVRGAADRNLGAFYSALPDSGWSAPSLTSSGLLLLVSSTIGGRHLYAAERSDLQYQFTTAGRVPMGAIGEPIEDRQAVVSNDCRTIYFSSVRAGGAGGADLYAADIAAE
jgi:hypothetical protein